MNKQLKAVFLSEYAQKFQTMKEETGS